MVIILIRYKHNAKTIKTIFPSLTKIAAKPILLKRPKHRVHPAHPALVTRAHKIPNPAHDLILIHNPMPKWQRYPAPTTITIKIRWTHLHCYWYNGLL